MARVLVIEDDNGIMTLLLDLLTSEGHEARGALDQAALTLADEWQPDLVLLDLMMPGLDGFAINRALRANARTRTIPIVVMSAGYYLREHLAELDVQGILAKPFDITTVLDWVDYVARPTGRNDSTAKAPPSALPPPTPSDGGGSGIADGW